MFDSRINKSKAWKKLESHCKSMRKVLMRDLFEKDSKRAQKFTESLDETIILDYSKNRITDKTMSCLMDLARSRHLEEKIKAMFRGDKINITENRAVLHIALRNRENRPIEVNGKDVMPDINAVLKKMRQFSEDVRFGKFKGYTGKKLVNIVNIGIGGSDLGPYMATEALRKYWMKGINCYFISNIDGTACAEVLNKVDPETTLFIVASKTFTTIETLTNAKTCRKWLVDALGEPAVSKHFVALSTNAEEVAKFGIDTNNMFEFWDFVGGRYSMWSAIGLIIAIAAGYDNFEKMLAGAYEMDKHFKNAELSKNIPVILALLSVWYDNFFGIRNHVIVPYDQYLMYLPAYLQQLVMESNGKSIDLDNKLVKYQTSPVLFGGAGTDDGHRVSVAAVVPGLYIAFAESGFDDGGFVLADGDGRVDAEFQDAALFAQGGADAAGEFGEVIGAGQYLVGLVPVALPEGILELGRTIAQRAGPMAEGHAAVHAA